MMRLRHTVQSVLCCLLCLTVCAVPAFAVDVMQYPTNFNYELTNSDLTFIRNVNNVDTTYGMSDLISTGSGTVANFFKGGFTYSWSLLDGTKSFSGSSYGFTMKIAFDALADIVYTPYGTSGSYYNVAYSPVSGVKLGSASSLYFSNDYFAIYDANDRVYSCVVSNNANNNGTAATGFSRDSGSPVSFKSDSVTILWSRSGNTYSTAVGSNQSYWLVSIGGSLSYTGGIDYIEVIADNTSTIITNQEQIKAIMSTMQGTLNNIDSTVTDTSQQLQNPQSNIWQAAGSVISEKIQGLFVPSADDLAGVKDGFDQLAQDKLGGAYQSVDLVKDGVSQVRDKINNPTADYSVEFPGIEVPLGETYGTVRLIGRQDVTIPQKMRDVLYPIAGIIIPIVCTTWTVRLGIDMVNCFMSGMSYAEFLHQLTDDEEDES